MPKILKYNPKTYTTSNPAKINIHKNLSRIQLKAGQLETKTTSRGKTKTEWNN